MSGEKVHLMLKTSISGVVRAVIAMGRSLGIMTTAEGVETPQQFNQLKFGMHRGSGLPVEPAEAGSRSQRTCSKARAPAGPWRSAGR